jgi:hypothetical protein
MAIMGAIAVLTVTPTKHLTIVLQLVFLLLGLRLSFSPFVYLPFLLSTSFSQSFLCPTSLSFMIPPVSYLSIALVTVIFEDCAMANLMTSLHLM